MPVTGSRRSYIAPRETEYRYSDDVNNEDEDDEAASIRAEEVRERFRKGVRRVICVLRMMKEMPGETWRKSLGKLGRRRVLREKEYLEKWLGSFTTITTLNCGWAGGGFLIFPNP